MYLMLLSMLATGAVSLLVLQQLPGPADEPAQQARAQLQQYQAFLYTSRAFFSQTPVPSVTTAYGWNALSVAAVPAMTQAGMPPHWKAVRRPDGYWVACTELTELTLAMLPALFPAPGQPAPPAPPALLALSIPAGSISVVVGSGGGSEIGPPSYVVLGQQSGEAAASANLCSGTGGGAP